MYKPFFLQRLLGSAPPHPEAHSRAAVRSARVAASICHELQSQRGEGSGAFIAREALAAYQSLDEPALEVFFSLLVKEFSLDPEAVGRSADTYRKDPSPANLVRLQRAVESPRQELFRRLNMAPGGPPLLRVFPSGAARRAGDLHRSGAHPRNERQSAAAARPRLSRGGSRL